MAPREAAVWIRRSALWASAIPALVVILLAQMPSWYPGELACQWTIHAAILLLPGWISRRHDPRWGRVFLIATALALLPWLRAAYQTRAVHLQAPDERPVPVVFADLGVRTPDRDALHRALADTSAEIIGLAGIVPSDRVSWSDDARYPHQIWIKDADRPAELALLSQARIVASHIHDLGGVHAIEALIDLGAGPLRVFLVHLSPPASVEAWHARDQQLGELARLVSAVGEPTLVMGDFNMTPGDPLWPVLLKAGHLLPGAGAEPASWPSLLGPCGIAIDHVLVRGAGLDGLQAVHLRGCDHRGVRAVATVPMGR
jgi:endonuclease/exonuclease/phosphatase (EEP) superfamily protein YafD